MGVSRRWTSRGRGRGRPSRRTVLYVDFLESTVLIAGKHDLDPKLLIEAFVEAWRGGPSQVGDLKVTCREVKQDSATFLITLGDNVVSQFPITLQILKNPEYVKDQIQHFPPSHYEKKRLEGMPKKISQLSYGMRRIDLTARIVEVPPAINVHTRFGTMASVSNIKISDETGSVRLSLWNDQIDKVHVGDLIELKNCYIFKYKGEPQLRLGRKGTLSVVEGAGVGSDVDDS
ncbi:hypothetical protein KAI11_00655 [Candidatus Bathyarchaeota archaeon]|nr:hypothetical protein [Candidatus Bathyarchaeota archaeon]